MSAHAWLEADEFAERSRSFSTDPRELEPLDAARLRELQQRERALHERVQKILEAEAHQAALLARVGSDLSSLRFATEAPRYTHMGVALRRGERWYVDHLLNTHSGPRGHLYHQPLIDFFRDDPCEYRIAVLVPSRSLQERLAALIASPLRSRLYTGSYSKIAYPFSTRHGNSNQWVAEIVGAAQGGGESRAEVQRFLAANGLQPTVLLGIGPARQLLSRVVTRNTRVDDHPARNRLRGRFEFVMEPSLRAYLEATDDLRAVRTVEL